MGASKGVPSSPQLPRLDGGVQGSLRIMMISEVTECVKPSEKSHEKPPTLNELALVTSSA